MNTDALPNLRPEFVGQVASDPLSFEIHAV